MENYECTPAELQEQMNSDNPPKLIDVREQSEWDIVHLEGGVLLTQPLMDEITESWHHGTPIVFYCHHGVRSVQALLYLRQHGFDDVRSMKGGIDAWAEQIEPGMTRY